MTDFKKLLKWSLAGHLLVLAVVFAGSSLPRRTAPARAVYHVRFASTAGPAADVSPEESLAPARKPEPESEVRISPEEKRRREEEERKRREDQQRREEERRRRAEEQARRRRELEEARRRREAEERERRESEEREIAELQRLRQELSEARDVGGLRTGSGPVLPPGYADRVHNLIFSAWEPVAVRGTAELSFMIGRDGRVSGINIERSSGSGPFDESCRRAVLEAGGMPPLPEGLGREGVRVYVTFRN